MRKHGNRFLDIFLILFCVFCEISGPLSYAAYRNVHNLLIKIPGPLNPAAYKKGPQFWIFHEIFGPLNQAT